MPTDHHSHTLPWEELYPLAREKGYQVNPAGELVREIQFSRLAVNDHGKEHHFSIWWGKRHPSINSGRFAAYCHFGDVALDATKIVKYKDGNKTNLSKSNLELVPRPEPQSKSKKTERAFIPGTGGLKP